MSGLEALLLASSCPIELADLGRGSRLVVPDGLSFGALQARREGGFHDWLRDEPDRHHVHGSRHALHLGVDLAFYVRRGTVRMLPGGLPVRAPADGVVAAAFASGVAELEPGGLILVHGDADDRSVRAFTYLGDVRDRKRRGERVRAGEVIAETLAQTWKRVPRVLVHLGIGLSIPGHGLEFIDPAPLLRRWRVRHPVFPGSRCTPQRLRAARPGTWRAPAGIEGERPGPRWDPAWRTRY